MVDLEDTELLRKHANVVRDALAEARVKAYTKHSKKGKVYTVGAHERKDAQVRKLKAQHDKLQTQFSKQLKKENANKEKYWNMENPPSDKISAKMDTILQKIHSIRQPKRRYGMGGPISYQSWRSRQPSRFSRTSGNKPGKARGKFTGRASKFKQAPPGIVPGQGSNTDFWGNRYK